MTPKFITLPSGLRVNTDHILHYRYVLESPNVGYTRITMESNGNQDDVQIFEESMTAERLDDLLSPQQSAVVDPIPTSESMDYNKPFRFKFEDRDLHGLIDSYGFNAGSCFVRVLCDGVYYRCMLGTSLTIRD